MLRTGPIGSGHCILRVEADATTLHRVGPRFTFAFARIGRLEPVDPHRHLERMLAAAPDLSLIHI